MARSKMPAKKNTKKVTKKKVTKRTTVTAPQAQAIRELADQVGKLISLEGYRSSFSLTTVAKEKGLTKYIPKQSANKKEAFYGFLLNLHKHKPRTIKILIREILPVAIEKRHKKGDPVLEAEALELSAKLKAAGIDMSVEIAGMNLPKERPKTVPPPVAIQKILDAYALHPSMLPDCKQMFIEGHINESVRKALERFEKLIQDLTSLHDKQGPDLMAAERYPFLKTTILSIIPKLIQRIWQNRVIELQRKLKMKSSKRFKLVSA